MPESRPDTVRASGFLRDVGATGGARFLPLLPYGDWTFSLAEGNTLIARSPGRPVLVLDEITMTWKELTT